MNIESVVGWAGLLAVTSPLMLLLTLGLSLLIGLHLSERVISRLTQASILLGLTSAVTVFVYMLASGDRYVPIEVGDWVAIEREDFHFRLKFIFDRLSVPFAVMSFVLCGTVGVFTTRYLHRDAGYRRFFLLYAFFYAGMVMSALAGTIETLFFGWELVGLSSALLIAYFNEREMPVRNGQRVWSVYRLSDAAFLLAAITMHKLTGEGDFGGFTGQGAWPGGHAAIDGSHATVVGLLLVVAAAGKSALLPFSGWLPRAMEGPTPSSAVFYGSLSVHLGAYLLLRVGPILEQSWVIQAVLVALGLASAVAAAVMSRVQADVKTALAYASMTQVGLIVAEIGLGLRYIPLIHILGHASLRTLQLLRAPSLLRDYQTLENAVGGRWAVGNRSRFTYLPARLQLWVYRFGYERGFMDTLLDNYLVLPFLALFRGADSLERRWTDWLSREPSRQSDRTPHHPEQGGRAA